jgi:hypothetical protein
MMRAFNAFAVSFLVVIETASAAPVSEADLAKLKLKREVANDFMRLAAEHTLKLLKRDTKPEEEPKIKYLQEQLATPNYFRGSTKVEDLLDFQLWVHRADKLGIVLSDKDLNNILEKEFCGRLDTEARKQIDETLRKKHAKVTAEFIMNSVRDEFRVQRARKALLGEDGEGKDREKKP